MTRAQATGTLKFPVGGRKPGIIPRKFANRMKKNEAPRSGKYFFAFSFEPSMFVKRSNKKSIVRISKIVLIENFSSGNTESSFERAFFIVSPARVRKISTRIDPNI
jgi:hypothetical protein